MNSASPRKSAKRSHSTSQKTHNRKSKAAGHGGRSPQRSPTAFDSLYPLLPPPPAQPPLDLDFACSEDNRWHLKVNGESILLGCRTLREFLLPLALHNGYPVSHQTHARFCYGPISYCQTVADRLRKAKDRQADLIEEAAGLKVMVWDGGGFYYMRVQSVTICGLPEIPEFDPYPLGADVTLVHHP